MVTTNVPAKKSLSPFKRWMLKGLHETQTPEGLQERRAEHQHQHPWWKVMCLMGVDYFSTLGYQPGIAFIAAGALSPIATLILVLLTLLGAFPIYSRVAAESPNGEGSISMLEQLLSRWKGKLFVLVLLGFVATDFIITITLSAADATAHVVVNPYAPHWMQHHIVVTLALISLLGAIFLKGFKEAIGLAVVLVGTYLLLNSIVISYGLYELFFRHPDALPRWVAAMYQHPQVNGRSFMIVGIALLLFPKLALGLSGFETGVAVMPLVKGGKGDTPEKPAGRIRGARRLLLAAALIMSVFLITSSLVTATLIPPEKFELPVGAAAGVQNATANGRALAFLAYQFFGNGFGTIYDLSTIAILWFAGASAMAGLLNIVPRYLPRYGMAPNWARATRPLVFVYIIVAFAVTLIFKADVEAQGGAYATGVLVLMSSAAVAVTLSTWHSGKKGKTVAFALIAVVFAYTTVVNVFERPEGIKIASFFIGAIILTSLLSRVWRTTELRVERVELDETAQRFIEEASQRGREQIRIVANRCDCGDVEEYEAKEREKREDNHIPTLSPVLFFEVKPKDASEFSGVLKIQGVDVGGYRVLRTESPAVPNAIAAFLLHLRDTTGKIPHAYFGWTEGNPLAYLFRYIAFGEGDTAPVTHEVLRQAEDNPDKRPVVHVGG
ncbi:MAG: amino acid transporter [Pyrinomonadaceae bacterium]